MKIFNLEFGVGEKYNDKFYAKLYSDDSKNTYSLNLELDEEGKKIIDFNCTCKGVSIPKSMGKTPNECKHVKQFIRVIKEMGYLE